MVCWKLKTEEEGGVRTNGSVSGHGAAFLPNVKCKTSRGIINKMVKGKRFRDTFTQGGIFIQTRNTGSRYWLHVTNYSRQHHIHHKHTPTHRLGRGELGGGVMSRCRFVFWTWAIFQRGERGVLIWSAFPTLTPSLRGDVSTFPRNSARTQECQGLYSDKIYRRGATKKKKNTIYERTKRDLQQKHKDSQLSCHTDQTKQRSNLMSSSVKSSNTVSCTDPNMSTCFNIKCYLLTITSPKKTLCITLLAMKDFTFWGDCFRLSSYFLSSSFTAAL